MRAIAPRTGAAEMTIAEEQEEYLPITIALYWSDTPGAKIFLTRWQPSAEERAAIAAGEDIYVGQMIFPDEKGRELMTPMMVQCGPQGFTVAENGNAAAT
jgi:hypothetical protein